MQFVFHGKTCRLMEDPVVSPPLRLLEKATKDELAAAGRHSGSRQPVGGEGEQTTNGRTRAGGPTGPPLKGSAVPASKVYKCKDNTLGVSILGWSHVLVQ